MQPVNTERTMQLARHSALMLLEISTRTDPEFKVRLEAVAQMWLSLTIINEQFSSCAADGTERFNRRA
jgi:hypothetical protein